MKAPIGAPAAPPGKGRKKGSQRASYEEDLPFAHDGQAKA
jgi:hypothetical protein